MKNSPSRDASIVIVLALLWSGCGRQDDETDEADEADEPTSGFFVPSYDDSPADDFAADLSDVTSYVVSLQNRGANLAKVLAENGLITLEDGKIVQLTELSRNECPDDVANCDVTDSAELGIGSGAMIADLKSVQEQVVDQGGRSTCVAFALNGALALLRGRNGGIPDLSEQYTYFAAKKLTNSWDSGGISPSPALNAMIESGQSFTKEENWPYNPVSTCETYQKEHEGYACSETEAQGSGSDGRAPEPKAEAAPEFKLKTVHQLYASLGRIKQALYRGHPVLIGVNANSDFSIAERKLKLGVVSWIFKEPDCGADVCGHAILAVGYQDNDAVAGGGFLVLKNSWGPSWGESGIAYATYEWVQKSLLEALAIVEIE